MLSYQCKSQPKNKVIHINVHKNMDNLVYKYISSNYP